MRRALVSCAAAVLGLTVLAAAPPTGARPAQPAQPAQGGREAPPSRIGLPDGFQPEGIAIGPGPVAWLGSRVDGDVYRVSLLTGEGRRVVQGPGTAAVGLKSDRDERLWIAGGDAGTARVQDARTGVTLAGFALTDGESFVNDVVLTRRAAWFTDSAQPQLYRVRRDRSGAPRGVSTVPLTGDWVQGTGFGANGISTTPNGARLLVVNSTSGLLYRVDPRTGAAREVDLGGASLTMGDGMLRDGRTLYVVRNRANEVVVLRLDRRGASGRVVRTITADDLGARTSFDVPTTVARFGDDLYLPNGRFTTTPTPTTRYWITRVPADAGS